MLSILTTRPLQPSLDSIFPLTLCLHVHSSAQMDKRHLGRARGKGTFYGLTLNEGPSVTPNRHSRMLKLYFTVYYSGYFAMPRHEIP